VIYRPLHKKWNTYEWTEYWIKVMKDFRRTLDYLETRPDINMDKVAIESFSWGMFAGTILPAIEDRLAANVILLSGMFSFKREELNPINYIRRVKIPTLVILGKYDQNFKLEEMGKPLFDLLGTPEDQKHLEICDQDHYLERNIVIRGVLSFLDKYLGPVRPAEQH
jgi:hypothetical protein